MTRRAKVFMNGRSQAVRLPKEFRFDCDEVYVRKSGDSVILSAAAAGWDVFFAESSAFADDFLAERADSLPQDRAGL